MADARVIFEWARENGEVKAVDRILIKVMLLLIKHRITLTARAVESMEERLELPQELLDAIMKAAETVVGKPFPASVLN